MLVLVNRSPTTDPTVHRQDGTLGGCGSYTRYRSAAGNSGCKVYQLPHRGPPQQHRLSRLWWRLLGVFLGQLLNSVSQHS